MKISLANKIVEAMRKQEAKEFAKSDIVAAAFSYFHEDFALDGYPQWPDSNKVLTYLYGSRGLIAAGRVVKDGDSYRLAEPAGQEPGPAAPLCKGGCGSPATIDGQCWDCRHGRKKVKK